MNETQALSPDGAAVAVRAAGGLQKNRMTPSPPPPPRQHPLPGRRLPRSRPCRPYEANVLTGEPKGADYPEGQRITSVMVNNIVAARPQRGLSKADILFEIKVEGGITRFMPVFTDYKTIGEIGPCPLRP